MALRVSKQLVIASQPVPVPWVQLVSADGQAEQAVFPVPAAYVEPVQDVHALADVLPVLALTVPAAHSVRPPVVMCDSLCVPP